MIPSRPISVAVTLVGLLMCLACAGKKYTVAKLEAPAGKEIRVLTDYYYENDRQYYYQILANGDIKVSTTYICTGSEPDKLRFELIPGKQGDVIGVVESRRPGEVLIIYNSRSGESWPQALPSESFENTKTRGLNLLQKLQTEMPSTKLKLSDSKCG